MNNNARESFVGILMSDLFIAVLSVLFVVLLIGGYRSHSLSKQKALDYVSNSKNIVYTFNDEDADTYKKLNTAVKKGNDQSIYEDSIIANCETVNAYIKNNNIKPFYSEVKAGYECDYYVGLYNNDYIVIEYIDGYYNQYYVASCFSNSAYSGIGRMIHEIKISSLEKLFDIF